MEDDDDRSEFYKQVNRLEQRLTSLRERNTASYAPTSAIIQLEDFADELGGFVDRGFAWARSFPETAAEKRRREKRKEEWRSERIEEAKKERSKISEEIQALLDALDRESDA